jgi:hypothetical protein
MTLWRSRKVRFDIVTGTFLPILGLTLGLALPRPARGQDEDKIARLFQDALEALGGQAYLAVTDMVSSGQLFYFNREGANSNLIKFDDYTKLPDKSRYEEGNNKKARDVTVFNLGKNQGWILEGQKPTREATPDEMKGFQAAVKHSIDVIMRYRYKDPANKLYYLGPGQGSDVIYEMVKLLDPENDEVTVYFDRLSKLPARLVYSSQDKQGVHLRYQVEFSQWHVIQGVKSPLRTDTSVNGRRLSQVFTLQLTYNTGLADDFFARPEPPK